MRFAALLLLALALPGGLSAKPAPPKPPPPPVVVELYTAQGCEACARANDLLDDLAGRKDVIALTLPVDYWDYLGWKDTLARPEFAERQRAYAPRLGVSEVYTPQVVVDGGWQTAGVQGDRVDGMIERRIATPRFPPDMLFTLNGKIAIGSGRAPKGGADVWLVRYAPGVQEVEVRRGENRGQTFKQRNVVREIRRLGAWRGRATAFRLPPAGEAGLATVVLVQATNGGRILGALAKP